MKTLLITIALMTSAASFADCSLTLKFKKDGAKSAKLDGVSFSTKQIEALSKVCTITKGTMTNAELIEDFKASLDRQAAKLAKAAAESK